MRFGWGLRDGEAMSKAMSEAVCAEGLVCAVLPPGGLRGELTIPGGDVQVQLLRVSGL